MSKKRKTYRNLTPNQFIALVYEGHDLKQYKEAYPDKYEAYCRSLGVPEPKAKSRVILARRILRDPTHDAERLQRIASLQIPFQALVDACQSREPDEVFNEYLDLFRVPQNDEELVTQEEAVKMWRDTCHKAQQKRQQAQPTLFSEAEEIIVLKETLAQLQATAKGLEDKIKRLDNAVQ